MSEQQLETVETEGPLPGQGTVKSRIDDLINSAPADEKKPDEKKPDETDESDQAPGSGESLEHSSVDDEIESLDADDQLPETDEQKDEKPVETLDAKKLAEKLEVSVEEIYAMSFPYGENGDAITLGELKDAGIRARTIDEETETLADERNSFINDQMKSRTELQSIVSMLPDGIPPELVQAANYQRQQAIQRERSNLLATIPEWEDNGKETIARGAISENLKQYGFQQVEIDNMLDHRLVKLMHDFTRMRQKIVKPRAELQKIKKKAGGKKRPGSRTTRGAQAVAKAKQQGQEGDVKGGINTLLPRG